MAPSKKKVKIAIACLLILRRRRRRRRQRKFWIRSWIERRQEQGAYANLVHELKNEDPNMYKRYFRMDPDNFQHILAMIRYKITKQETNMRKPVSPAERLAVTLRYLVTGETFHSLSFAYRIGERTISTIVTETATAIYECMADEYLKVPVNEQDWLKISQEFKEKWNYPFCLGAIDGKHINVRQPANSGSEFFNYKHFFSILLLAVVDANYKFIYVDVGATGRSGDAGVFAESTLKQAMDNNSLSFPQPGELEGTQLKCSYHVIGDDAFPLREDIMKPYPQRDLTRQQRMFNYRFSRARRVVENVFGIMANRFRLFLTTICLDPDKVQQLVLAACCLHNFLMDTVPAQPSTADQEDLENHGLIPVSCRDGTRMTDLAPTTTRNCSLSAKGQRHAYTLFQLERRQCTLARKYDLTCIGIQSGTKIIYL